MLWRFIAVMLLAYGTWTGFDGLRINLASPEITEVLMRELEQNGIGDSRWLRVSMAIIGENFAVNYSEETEMVSSIFYTIYDPFRLAPEIMEMPLSTNFEEVPIDSLIKEHTGELGTAFAVVKEDVSGVHLDEVQEFISEHSPDLFEGIVSVGWDGRNLDRAHSKYDLSVAVDKLSSIFDSLTVHPHA